MYIFLDFVYVFSNLNIKKNSEKYKTHIQVKPRNKAQLLNLLEIQYPLNFQRFHQNTHTQYIYIYTNCYNHNSKNTIVVDKENEKKDE